MKKTASRIIVVLLLITFLVGSSIMIFIRKAPSPTKTEIEVKYFCKSDSDCICGGIDKLTGECFVGNIKYYEKYVDKTKICPDFCTGIAGNIQTKCIENECKLVVKEKV